VTRIVGPWRSSARERVATAIAVFGAKGHTGQFVLREIERRGVRAIPIGRDAAKLVPGGRVAAMDDPRSLDGAVSGGGGR
jgi:short subunit dehydrogenase-like uncharacterized protein